MAEDQILATFTELTEEINATFEEGTIINVIIANSMAAHEFDVDLVEGQITEVDTSAYASTQPGYPFAKCLMVLMDPANGNYPAPIIRQKVQGDSDIIEVGFPPDSGETITGLKLNIVFYNQ